MSFETVIITWIQDLQYNELATYRNALAIKLYSCVFHKNIFKVVSHIC
jgi:hypothetical protein